MTMLAEATSNKEAKGNLLVTARMRLAADVGEKANRLGQLRDGQPVE